MTDFMIDLETMSARSDAAIVSIGAVEFSAEKGLGEEFYANVDLASAMRCGGRVDGDTILWWLRQSDEARKVLGTAADDIAKVLQDFSGYIRKVSGKSTPVLWGNSCSFDNVILRNAYEGCGLVAPWNYRGDRCYRTMKDMFPEVPPVKALGAGNVAHNALDDAKFQARHLIVLMECLAKN